MKKLLKSLLLLSVVLLTVGCVPRGGSSVALQKQTHEVVIIVKAADPAKVEITEGKGKINRGMEVANPEGALSTMSFILKDEVFIAIFSGLSVSDVKNLWNDFAYLYKMTKIRKVNIFMNSGGGDAFSGLALADQITRAKKMGFYITIHASGIVASAAVPVFVVGSKRLASPGTIFMVHEASIWKWPGRETASDIRSQNRLMELLRDRYIGMLVDHGKLTRKEWELMERETTWFSAEQAKDWGLVDAIE